MPRYLVSMDDSHILASAEDDTESNDTLAGAWIR